MKAIISPVILLIVIFFVGCVTTEEEGFATIDYHVFKDIPVRIQDSVMTLQRKQTIAKMHVPDLEKGFDSFYIRFWMAPGPHTDSMRFLSIGYNGTKWKCVLTDALVQYDEKTRHVLSVRYKSSRRSPKDQWSVIARILSDFALLYQRDFTNISSYVENMDDSGVGVEWADTKQYRFYSLPGLSSNPVAGRTLARC